MRVGNHLGDHPGKECWGPRPEPPRIPGVDKPWNHHRNHPEPLPRTRLGTVPPSIGGGTVPGPGRGTHYEGEDMDVQIGEARIDGAVTPGGV
jgi:hypothetical protein